MPRLFSEEEVARHNSAVDCWLILGAHGAKKVYDVTAFLEDHPGGPEILLDLAGQDVEEEFQDIVHSKAARAMLDDLYIGDLKEESDRRAFHEAQKMSRRSLLTHPELIQRTGPWWRSWSLGIALVSVAVVVVAVVAAAALTRDGKPIWRTLLEAINAQMSV